MRFYNLFIAVAFCFLIGCGEEAKTTTQSVNLPAIDSEGESASQTPDVTTAEAETYAEKYLLAVEQNDINTYRDLVLWTDIMERSLEGLGVDEDFKRGFLQGASSTAPQLLAQLSQNNQMGGSYRLVRVVKRAGQTHVVLRLIDPQGLLNYHDLQLTKRDGRVAANFFFIAATGEEFADTLRTTVRASVIANQSTLSRLSGDAKKEMEAFQKKIEFVNKIKLGQNTEALAIYETLPESARNEKLVQISRLKATDVADEEAYLAVLDEIKRRFPGDSGLDFILMDAAILRKDYDRFTEHVAEIKNWTGGDPYMDLMAAGVFANGGRVQEAEDMVSEVDVDALRLPIAHDLRLSIGLAAKDYDTVLYHLKKMRDEFGVQFSDLSLVPDFAEFSQSPQYQEWLK